MNITILGGSGFIGTRLMHLFEDDTNFALHNIDLKQSHFFPHLTQIGDVRKQDDLDRMLAGANAVVLLAAEHRDDVRPVSAYYETNVGGMRCTLNAMEKNGVKRLIFFSSVSVYGLNKDNPNEETTPDPFNNYGKSKWEAEQVLREWMKTHNDWSVTIIRPTVIFGERNRGNVYNLLKQIASGRFLMVGNGKNLKSMAYVGNVVAFVKFLLQKEVKAGCEVFNYIDKPDYNMNDLVELVERALDKHIPSTHFPYWLGMMGGYCFDALAWLTRRKLTISSVRVKKFCATTQFDSTKAISSGFVPPYTMEEGLRRTLEFEFVHPREDDIEYYTE